jgi:hypothetical protein
MGAASRFVGSGALLAHLSGKRLQKNFIKFMGITPTYGEHSAKSPMTI